MFKEWIRRRADEQQSKIVLALDFTDVGREQLFSKSLETVKQLAKQICAIKVNRHLSIPLGVFDGVERIVREAHSFDIPTIMDCKINDIGNTNLAIARGYFQAGFDAVTVSPYVGWEGGLESVFTFARDQGKGVITIVYMSHKGAEGTFGQKLINPSTGRAKPQYRVFAERSLEWKADGVVVGATRPSKIWEVHRFLKGQVPIYAPGIGIQGGKIKDAVEKGAEFLIVGRSIINAANPVEAAERIRRASWRFATLRYR